MMVVATREQDEASINGEPPSTEGEEQKIGVKEVAIEVTLPSIFAMHIQNSLKQRGVAMNEFILELLARYVPIVVDYAAVCPEDIDTTETTSDLETRA